MAVINTYPVIATLDTANDTIIAWDDSEGSVGNTTADDIAAGTITGAASTIYGTNLTASRALQSSGTGKVEVSSVTATELGYVSGVTSAIQTQLNSISTVANAASTERQNFIYNGNFDIWSKGTSFLTPSDDTYYVDGWNFVGSVASAADITQETTGAEGSRYFLRLTSNNTTNRYGIVHFIEASEAIALRDKTVTFSFYQKGTVSAFLAYILSWTGTADSLTSDLIGTHGNPPSFAASWTSEAVDAAGGAGAWTQTSVSGSIDTAGANNIAVLIYASTTAAGQTLDISRCQLTVSSTAPTYVPPILSQEVARAQRRYLRLTGDASNRGPAISQYASAAAQAHKQYFAFPTEMRTTPATAIGGTWATVNCTGPTLANVSNQGAAIVATSSAAGIVSLNTNSTDDYLEFDAEL